MDFFLLQAEREQIVSSSSFQTFPRCDPWKWSAGESPSPPWKRCLHSSGPRRPSSHRDRSHHLRHPEKKNGKAWIFEGKQTSYPINWNHVANSGLWRLQNQNHTIAPKWDPKIGSDNIVEQVEKANSQKLDCLQIQHVYWVTAMYRLTNSTPSTFFNLDAKKQKWSQIPPWWFWNHLR